MAMSVRYHSIDGELLYQSGPDGRIDYLPDALGNVMATTKPNQPAVVDNTYRYKPYGDRLAKTGTGIDPKYQWVGTRTYRDTSLAHSSHYMIHRHYAEEESRWTTVDPIWPWEQSYGYANCLPTLMTDSAGMQAQKREAPGFVRNDRYGCPALYSSEPLPCEKDPCGYSIARGDGGTDAAWVVCCNEKSYVCTAPGINPDVKECIQRHERYHALHGSCRGKGYDRLRFDQPYDDPDWEECAAHLIEAGCIKQKLIKKCGPKPSKVDREKYLRWLKCAGGLAMGIIDACSNAETFCKDSGKSDLWQRICQGYDSL